MYFVEKTSDIKFWKHLDYYIFIPVLLLSTIGLLVVRSAVMSRADGGLKIFFTQALGFFLGLVLCLLIAKFDYKDLKTLAYPIYGFGLFLLLLVLLIGTGDDLGSRRWLLINGVSLQPTELLKIAFIIMVSMHLEQLFESTSFNLKSLLSLIFFAGLPIALIIFQKDFGTALIFFVILLTMLFIYGLKYRIFLSLLVLFILSTPLAWIFLLNESRKNRIRVFLDPTLDPLGAGLNVLRSKMTVGSGQLFGKGLFQGPQTQNSSVPVKESDFIFSVIGEELGFIGATLILVLICFLLIRLLFVAQNARDPFGAFLIVGIVSMIGTQSIENIGMSIGLFPVTGLTLPFISAGGSSMITNFLAIGVVLSVSLRRKRSIFKND